MICRLRGPFLNLSSIVTITDLSANEARLATALSALTRAADAVRRRSATTLEHRRHTTTAVPVEPDQTLANWPIQKRPEPDSNVIENDDEEQGRDESLMDLAIRPSIILQDEQVFAGESVRAARAQSPPLYTIDDDHDAAAAESHGHDLLRELKSFFGSAAKDDPTRRGRGLTDSENVCPTRVICAEGRRPPPLTLIQALREQRQRAGLSDQYFESTT